MTSMLRSLLCALLLCCVTAFAPPASLAVRPAVARAAGPMMKKTGGGGKSGGRNPTKDQVRRGKVRKMIFAADDAEKVSASLLGSDMEAMLIKMNWRVRHSMMKKIKNAAAAHNVEVPAGFAAHDVLPKSLAKRKIVPVTA